MENRLSLFCDRVVEAGWLAVAVTVPLFFNVLSSRVFEPDKLTLLRSIVLVMAAAWTIRVLTSNGAQGFSLPRFVRTSPLALPVLVFVAVYLLATALSVVPRVSFWGSYVRLQGLVTNLSYLTLFFLVAHNLRSRDQMDRLISVIIFTSIPISLYGVIQHQKWDPLPWGGDVTFRVTSTMGNAIFLAAYLIMVVPLTLVRLVHAVATLTRRAASGGARWREALPVVAYASALGLQLVTIVLTKSRGPWVGLAVGLAFLALLWLLRLGRRRAAGASVAVFVALLAFTLVINIPKSPLEPVKKSSAYLERLGSILDMESGTNRVRTLIWFGDGVGKGAAGLITANPWRTLLGWGPESMYVAYNPYYPPELAHLEARNATPDRSHNDLLDYLVTMGFLGLFAYLLVVVRAFSLGLQRFWKEEGLGQQGLLVGILGALLAHIAESITGIAIASTLTYTWLFLGVLVSQALGPRAEAVPAPNPLPPSTVPESRRARRRRMDKKGLARGEAAAAAGQPWFKNPGFYLLALYAFVTAIASIFVLRMVAPRDPEPWALVLGGYGWLLVGMLVAALWVHRSQAAPGRVRPQSLLLAGLLGLVAVLLPVKLFLGSVIADTYFKKGQNLATLQRFDQSVGPYLTAIQWDSDQDYYFLFLGQSYLELGRTTQEERPPQLLEGVNDLFRFQGPSVAQLGRENLFRAGLVALRRARELNPLNTDHSANLGRLYRLWGEVSNDPSVKREKWMQSVEYYQQATILSPNAAHLRAEWGLVYYFMGDFSEAFKRYQEADRLDSRYAPTYAYLGDLYRASGNEDAALDAYRKALELHQQWGTLLPPQVGALHAALGQMYFQRGLLRESLEENLKLAQLAPKDLAAHKNLALLYRELGDRRRALEEARLALSLAPPEERPSLQAFIAELQAPPP